jgi:hypothetical protein
MELGYRFYPLSILGHPGNRALEVVVKAQPTLKHFDPEKIRVMVGTEKQLIATAIISFPWHGQEKYQYAAGLIRITDRQQKVIDVFSFGGEVQVSQDFAHLSIKFHSSAPFFDKIVPDSTSELLASMFEGILAWRKGVWAAMPEQFDKRMLAVQPQDLYWLLINELLSRLAGMKELTLQFESLLQFLRREHCRLLPEQTLPIIDGSLADYL